MKTDAEVIAEEKELELARSFAATHAVESNVLIRMGYLAPALAARLTAANQEIAELKGALRSARMAMQVSLLNHGCDPCHLTEAIDSADATLRIATEGKPLTAAIIAQQMADSVNKAVREGKLPKVP